MEDHQNPNPNPHRGPNSGAHADLHFVDDDEILVIPDTPDRVSRQNKNAGKGPMATYGGSSSRNAGLADKSILDKWGHLFVDSGHNSVQSRTRGNSSNVALNQDAKNSDVSSSTFRNAPASGMVGGNTLKDASKHHFNHQHKEGGKVSHPKSSGSPHHRNRISGSVMVGNGERAKFSYRSSREELEAKQKVSHPKSSGSPHHPNKTSGWVMVGNGERAISSHKSSREELEAKHTNKVFQRANNGGHTVGDSSKSDRNDNKGKAKVGNDMPIDCDAHTLEGHDDICNTASRHNKRKGLSIPLEPARSPCAPKRIMLVRNGCIGPNNVAKAKQLAESSVNGHADDGNTQSGGSRHVIDVDEVDSKESAATRAKGKGVVVLPCSPRGHEDRKGNAGCFADERRKGKSQGVDCSVGPDNSNSNKALLGKCSSSLDPVVLLNEEHFRTPSTSSKRQKNAEVICLSSCGESSTSKSTMDHGGRPHRVLGSPIVVGELSPDVGEIETRSEVRALQLHADEMLARELQEQLYNEIPEASAIERDFPVIHEQLLQRLQAENTLPVSRGLPVPRGGGDLPVIDEQQLQQLQAENTLPVPRGGGDSIARRAAPGLNARRHRHHHQSLRNRFLGPGPQAQLPRSEVRLRTRLHRHVPVGGRNVTLPSDMAMDVRMGLLEALERVVNSDMRMVNQLLQSDREFNENDYEMLLALDENNHHHLGASAARIRNLPESIVQNEDSEACSICLETPAIGETIRHLPCVHKFHKDCIDTWLRRKRSCPICKSDV